MKKLRKRTPGPWTVAPEDACCIMAKGKHILTAHDKDGGRSEGNIGSRNARLAATAPELLSALETALITLNEIVDHTGNIADKLTDKLTAKLAEIESAIAKAKGESDD